MKKIILLFAFSMLFSCSNSEDNADVGNKSSYAPPTWIQGTWGVVDYSGVPTKFYTFTSDNVCQIITVSTICWKEGIAQNPTILSGNDISTATNYTANFISGGTTLTLTFKKISPTKILWTNTGSADFELDKLN